MGRANSRKYYGAEVVDPWKRERQTRHQAPPPTLPNVDVYGVLFAEDCCNKPTTRLEAVDVTRWLA